MIRENPCSGGTARGQRGSAVMKRWLVLRQVIVFGLQLTAIAWACAILAGRSAGEQRGDFYPRYVSGRSHSRSGDGVNSD